MDVGQKMRSLRLRLGLSLDRVAQSTGLSKGFLSRCERNLTSPSVENLKKIADALHAPIGSFFGEESGNSINRMVVRKDQRKKVVIPGSKYTLELLTPDLNRKMEFIIDYLEPGATSGPEPYRHEGEECGLVLKGRIQYWIGDEAVVLEEGDSIYFDSTIPHRWENIGTEQAVTIWTITPPSF